MPASDRLSLRSLIPLRLFKGQTIQHIFFDLDHTLWDFETNSKDAITDLYEEFKLTDIGLTLEKFLPVYFRCNEYCWDMYRKNQMKKDLLRHQRFYLTLKDFGIVDRQLSKKLGKRYVDISPTKTALMPGVAELLDYLSGKYPLHIITNGFQEVQSLKMRNSKIEQYFSKVITSEKVGKRKPEPKIFAYALKIANADAHSSVMIGDDLETDVKGAANAGLHAVWYNHGQKDVEGLEHPSIHHLAELKNYL